MVYISISHSKEQTEEATQAVPFPKLMWWGPAAGLGMGPLKWDLQSYLSILCTRRHIERGASFYPNAGISLWNGIFTTVSILSCVPVEEFGNCLVHHTRITSLSSSYIQLSKWIFWLSNSRTETFTLLTSRRPNSLIGSDTQLVGDR